MDPTAQVALIVSVSVVFLVVFLALLFRPRVTRITADVKSGKVSIDLSPQDKERARENLSKAEENKTMPTGASVQRAPRRIDELKRRLEKRILWVDDHPSNNDHERRALEPLGVEVVQVRDSEDALSKLSRYPYDMVITDLDREGNPRAGLDFVKAMRQKGLDLPVAVYTSPSALQAFGAEARQVGAQAVTASPSELVDSVLGGLASEQER